MRTLIFVLALQFAPPQTPQLVIQEAPSRTWDGAIRHIVASIVPVVGYRLGDEDEAVSRQTPGAHKDIVCTAVVIDRNAFLLLTELHCLAGEVDIEFDGVPEVRRYVKDQLVLLQTKGRAKGWESVEIRKSQVGLGESVGALGFVLGSQSPLFAPGTVTGSLWGGLLTTIPVWPGHSGSPIFDTSGRLVTLVRQTRRPAEYLSPWSYSEAQADVARFIEAGRAEFRRQDVAQKLRK